MGKALKYTYRVKGTYWRFRRAELDVALPGSPGDAQFHARYAELLALANAKPKAAPSRTSWAWLVGQYLTSAEFRALASETRDDYERTCDLIVVELGDQPFALTTRRMIKAVRDAYSDTPRKADKIRQMTSRLYSWADESELVPEGFNPVKGLKKLKHKVNPYVPWSDEEIELFLDKAPAHALTPVLLALYTGQRASDVVAMTWNDYKGSTIRVRQDKTDEFLDIYCHPRLRDHLDRLKATGGKRAVVMSLSAADKPYNGGSLSQALSRAIEAIEEMPHRTMHGLRYAAAARLEEAGCTIAEISAVLGHRTYQMAMKYIEQRKAAKRAGEKLEARA
ncbi:MULTISPECIES: tyrosine-type recombinase/integrase [unclassified Sphingomonas]|uniref:tyrosine-type recombinase/integrase n=1 Tax=unclassified Sphingomonas TaxID=196159 RepID=UPI00226A5763